jgi:hypothetical protein
MRTDSLVRVTKQYRVDHSCAVDIGDHGATDCGVIYPACPNLYFEGTSDWDGATNELYTRPSKPLLHVQRKPRPNQYQYDNGLYFFHESAMGCTVEITALCAFYGDPQSQRPQIAISPLSP